MSRLILFHRTSEEAARAIVESGFRDNTGTYLTGEEFTGVWLSNRPLDANEGAWGHSLLRVTIDLPESELTSYEWTNEGNESYREWFIPASLINLRAKVEIVDEDELEWEFGVALDYTPEIGGWPKSAPGTEKRAAGRTRASNGGSTAKKGGKR